MLDDRTRVEILNNFIKLPAIQKGINKKKIFLHNKSLEFRVQRFVFLFGIIGIVIAFGMLFLSNMFAKIAFSVIFGLPGFVLLFIGLFTRLFIDEERIEYRNPIGIRKTLYWRDIISVYYTSAGNVMRICSNDAVIEHNSLYNCAFYIDKLVKLMVPEAFDKDTLFKVRKTKEFNVNDGELIFKMRKVLSIFIILFFVVFWGAIIAASIVDRNPMPKIYSFIIPLWNIPLLILFLYSFVTRIYIGKKTVAKRNFIGRIRRIKWEDIVSVNKRNRDYIKVFSKNGSIRISGNMTGYFLLIKLVNEYSPKKALRNSDEY